MPLQHKGLLIILDGLGDRAAPAFSGATPLEAAHTPQLDQLAGAGLCGLMDPLIPGVPVGTHTGTGILLGLTVTDACKLSRGPVEAAGIGVPMQPEDVAIRCNFATLKPAGEGFEIIDRRAGRIKAGTQELAQSLHNVPLNDGITGSLLAATQHRAVLHLVGPGLSPAITDTDPGAGLGPARLLVSRARNADEPAGARTAEAVNRFVRTALEQLRDHPVNRARQARGQLPANGVVTRGAGMIRGANNLIRHLGLKAAVIAGEGTILGLARLFGFTAIFDPRFTALCDTDLGAKVAAARTALDSHDIVVLHIKATDICSHDRDPQAKRAVLERIDDALIPLLRDDLVIGVTGDHSTDCNTGRHCGDPVPSILYAPYGRRDACQRFGESTCMQGGLGRVSGNAFLVSMLDNMGCLHNFRPVDGLFYCGQVR